MVRAPLLVVALTVVCASSACKSEGRDPPANEAAGDEPAPAPLPEPKMIRNREPAPPDLNRRAELSELPEPESFAPADVPLRYPDGAYSIRGLREDFDERIAASEDGQLVNVRAWVQEIEVPPPGCKPGPRCRQAHMFVTDEQDAKGRRRAMLVGPLAYALSSEDARLYAGDPDVVVEVGQQYLLRGKFVRVGDSGFADERGLLELVAVADADGHWIYPKGSPSHPRAIARMEEQERDLLERMSREAEALERGR